MTDNELKNELWRAIDEKNEELLKLCSQLIAIPTENPQETWRI